MSSVLSQENNARTRAEGLLRTSQELARIKRKSDKEQSETIAKPLKTTFKNEDLGQYLTIPKTIPKGLDKGEPKNGLAQEFAFEVKKRNPEQSQSPININTIRKGLNESWLGRTVNGLPKLLEARNDAKRNKK